MTPAVVVLAGGTGGAKLARGMLDVVGDDLTVIANTGDDVEIYGAYVSPDPDLCTFWLADRIDERGWGLRDDSFAVMDGLRELGVDVWFALGDRDLAIAIERARRLGEGDTLTDTLADLGTAFGLRAHVLPMSDEPVRTWVRAKGRWMPFQEFMISAGAQGPIDDVQLRGVDDARPTDQALAAIAAADAIVVGPSNPVISIGPILAVPRMRQALIDSPAPIVAVSPVVGGGVLKGPTEAFMRWAGHPTSGDGVASCYAGLIDGLVADEPVDGLPVLQTDTLMRDAADRRRLAGETLRFAEDLT
ncbi:MAG TPA: 2-phospho-L-lactate transferase [Solirubrobacteraceae bacterium]|jgi:LPPG:FO 2-phospho-L-lactate transferase|nr:2-phospho-L-lactate transferase [Solirubrobacteraceae bacterium]